VGRSGVLIQQLLGYICNCCLKLGDVVWNSLEKDFGLRLFFMANFPFVEGK
jgi:hypothetical protein